MYRLIETVKNVILCESAVEEGNSLILKGAFTIPPDKRDADPADMARLYIRARLLQKIRTVKISSRSLESQEDAEEVTPIIELLEKYIPIAERQARARMILQEASKLAGLDDYDEEDD